MDFLGRLFRLKFYFIVLEIGDAISTSEFTHVDEKKMGAFRVGDPWSDRSVTSCLVTCQLRYSSCHSAMYDLETKMCTPGSQVSYGSNEVTSSVNTLFYVLGGCNFNDGFVLFTHNSFVTCLFLASEQINYFDARESCRIRKAHLYTAKSLDKLDIFLQIAVNIFRGSTWIGLSDLVQEGAFVWEDGELLNSSLIVWGQNQPDNSWGVEHCAGTNWYVNYLALNDLPCSENDSFICEPDGWPY